MKKFLLTNLMLAITAQAFAITPYTLNQVEINGVTKNQGQDILGLLQLKQGTTINDKEIASIIRKLYATGNFTNVAVNPKGNDLVIDLQLKQIIASLNFKGNSLIPTDQIRQTYEQNNIRQGAILNEDALSSLNEEVEKFYQSQGYSQVSVSTKVTTLEDGTVNVDIIVDEKKKAYLQTLNITGNNTFTQKQILSESIIRPGTHWYNFYHNSHFTNQGKKQLLDNIANYYLDRGYVRYKVLSQKEENSNAERPQDVTFNITISEGNVYSVNQVKFFTRDEDLDSELAKFNQVTTQSTYNKSKVDATVELIKNYLAGLGYADPKISPVLDINDSNNTVTVTFAVDKGVRYTVSNIKFKGNYLTKDEVLRRELLQHENAIYNLNLVNEDVTSLLRTGNFQDVTYKTEKVEGSADLLNLEYEVKETANGNFQIGIGYGDTQGITYTAKLQQNNFLGTGRSVGIDLERSSGRSYMSLDYTEPYVTNYGLSINGSIYYSKVNTEKYKRYYGYNYQQEVYGVTLGTSIPVSRYGRLSGSVTYEQNRYWNLYPEYYRALYLNSIGQNTTNGSWKVRSRNVTFNLTYNYNTYDRYLFPTKGFDFTVGTGITSFLSTDKYYNFAASLKTFTSLNEKGTWVLGTRLGANHVRAFGNRYLPISALYTAGGSGTLRGLSYASVGPASINCQSGATCSTTSSTGFNRVNVSEVVGGDSLIYGGVDLYFPLFRGEAAKTVRTSFFVDTAAVWNTKWKTYTANLDSSIFKGYEDWSKPNFRVTAGFNLDWNSPMGLLSFSIGTPVVKKDYDDKEIFSINFGTTY